MACAEITNAIAWNKKSTATEEFPVVAYFSKHFGLEQTKPDDSAKDSVLYASGKVVAADAPTPHLKGTLAAAKNTDVDGQMVSDPTLTFDVEIFPDGTLTYQEKLNGKPVGGFPPTKVQANCVNDVLLTATNLNEVVTIGVALKKSIPGVTVHYKQIANFTDYRLSPDSDDSHGAGGMFIMYKITTIDNTASSAKTFVFDVNKVSTKTKDKTSNQTVTDANILLLGENLTTVTVPAGQTKTVNRCFIKDALTSNPKAIVAAQVPLTYQPDPTDPVTMTNSAPNASVAVVANALPVPLQQLCASG